MGEQPAEPKPERSARDWRRFLWLGSSVPAHPPVEHQVDPRRVVRYPLPECAGQPTQGTERTEYPDWEARPWADRPRIGIACSGGGIRSASFCLGALQAVDASTEDRRGIERVEYVSAVSGGGYTAGGWAVTASASRRDRDHPTAGTTATPGDDTPPLPGERIFSQSSPEEERLRRNSSLLPDTRTAAAGFGRVTMGLAINLLLLWGIMIAVAAPVGWLTSSWLIHDELKARTPVVTIEHQPRVLRDDSWLPEKEVPLIDGLTPTDPVPCSTGTCDAWTVDNLRVDGLEVDLTELDGEPIELSEEESPQARIDQDAPAIVVVDDAELRIAQQPAVVIDENGLPGPGGSYDEGTPTLSVDGQPKLAATSEPVTEPRADHLRVEQDPVIAERSGTTGQREVEYEPELHAIALATVAIAILLGALRIVIRPIGRRSTNVLRLLVRVSTTVAAAALLLFYVVPWIIVSVPPFIADLPTWIPFLGGEQLSGSSLVNTTAFAFFLTLIETGIRLLKGTAMKAARRWPLRVVRILVVVFLATVIVAVLADILEVAAANGPHGHLSDFILQPTFRVDVQWPVEFQHSFPDWSRWLAVLVLLAGWAYLADAHSWSLFPFYKRWISRAFISQRLPEQDAASGRPHFPGAPTPADSRDFTEPITWMDHSRLGGDTKPELIACCSVNLDEVNLSASGRKAGTFVFSRQWVGGPDVGWIPTEEYWTKLGRDEPKWFGKSRRKDITVVATMAISGAAFSPGMGKKSMGSIGGLMALANARLGVWLPHPRAVHHLAEGTRWRGRPGWPWWFREVIQRFRSDAPYLYVSDGGHWENLGVIELLRRGCNRVYAVSAAGDGVDGFTTVGEAIALAREELGIEIEGLDLDAMRTPRGEPRDGEDVLVHADGTTTRFSERTFTVGTLRRIGDQHPYGNIIVIEANLSTKIPWDVQSHAEKHSQFPDDSTLDQFFDDRQFESYRRLGQFQMARTLEAIPLDDERTRPDAVATSDQERLG